MRRGAYNSILPPNKRDTVMCQHRAGTGPVLGRYWADAGECLITAQFWSRIHIRSCLSYRRLINQSPRGDTCCRASWLRNHAARQQYHCTLVLFTYCLVVVFAVYFYDLVLFRGVAGRRVNWFTFTCLMAYVTSNIKMYNFMTPPGTPYVACARRVVILTPHRR